MSVRGQQELWMCPNDGTLITIERTGEVVNTRHYGRRELMRFSIAGEEVSTCPGCGRQLHFLANGQRPTGRPT